MVEAGLRARSGAHCCSHVCIYLADALILIRKLVKTMVGERERSDVRGDDYGKSRSDIYGKIDKR